MKRILMVAGFLMVLLATVFIGLTEGYHGMRGYVGDYVPLTIQEKAASDSFAVFLEDLKAR
jgi:hypothetical protein